MCVKPTAVQPPMNADKHGYEQRFAREPGSILEPAHIELSISTGTRRPVELRFRRDRFSDNRLTRN
jgi:hypothetical protein